MTRLNEQYEDLLGDTTTPARAHLIADLDRAYMATQEPPYLDAVVLHAVRQRATRRKQPGVWWGRQRRGRRLASLGAAIVFIVAGTGAYLGLQRPAPVLAQTILRRAAAAMPRVTPGEVIHMTMSYHNTNTSTNLATGVTTPGQISDGTTDMWMQQDADGSLARLDSTQAGSDGAFLFRVVQVGTTRTMYDALTRIATITTGIPSSAPVRRADENFPDFSQLVRTAQQGADQTISLLPQETLNGATVDVVETRQAFPDEQSVMTFYIDAQSYILRGIDSEALDARGTVLSSTSGRMLQYQIVPLSAVPSAVFAFTPPPGATVKTSTYTGPQ